MLHVADYHDYAESRSIKMTADGISLAHLALPKDDNIISGHSKLKKRRILTRLLIMLQVTPYAML